MDNKDNKDNKDDQFEKIRLKLEANEFEFFYELVIDMLAKISGKLYLSSKFDSLFSPYMLCRYISMRPNLLKYAELLNLVNSVSKLTKIQFYKFAYAVLPKSEYVFIKYIKKPEITHEEENNKINGLDNDSVFNLE